VTQPAGDLLDLKQAIRDGKVTRDGPDAAQVELVLPNGKTYPTRGRLQFSEVTVDPSSGSVTVRATFPNPDGTLLPGLYVRARLVEGVRKQAVLAPQQGITRDERGKSMALVIGAGDKVEQREVTTDRATGDKWIVTSGLNAGDRIIVEGQMSVKPGQQVSPRPPQQVTASKAAPASGN
jgi:membrane fusion protein, multidrug efflux system